MQMVGWTSTRPHSSTGSMVSNNCIVWLCVCEYVCADAAENVFGIGDCTNVPTSRTAAACAAESAVLYKNLLATMRGEVLTSNV